MIIGQIIVEFDFNSITNKVRIAYIFNFSSSWKNISTVYLICDKWTIQNVSWAYCNGKDDNLIVYICCKSNLNTYADILLLVH